MFYFIFALKKEAKKLIHHSQVQINHRSLTGTCFGQSFRILYIKPGDRSTEIFQTFSFTGEDLIVKLGTSAVLNPEIPLFVPLIPASVVSADQDEVLTVIAPSGTEEIFKISHFNLITLNEPLCSSSLSKSYFQKGFDLAEMEIYHLMRYFCAYPVIPLIVGTDRGDENSGIDFQRNLEKASEILAESAIFFMQNFRRDR